MILKGLKKIFLLKKLKHIKKTFCLPLMAMSVVLKRIPLNKTFDIADAAPTNGNGAF